MKKTKDWCLLKFFKNFFTPPKIRGEADDIFTATTNGVSVSNENALKISAVYACVRAISETISTLPFEIYQTDGKQRVIAQNHPIRPLIKVAPNPKMNIAQFLEALLTSMLLRGNGYIRPIRARNGQVLQLDILDASQVSLQERGNDVYFQYTGKDGTYNFGLDEIVNIPYFTLDGITGLSPIAKCRNGLELTQIAENHGKSFFSNGAFPSGVIEVPTELNQEAYDRMKNSWQKAYSGENAYKTAVLEGGAAYKGISIPNKDAQFLELRAFQTTDIARMFRVPPHMIADLTKATFSNIEQQSKEFAEFTILPLVVKIEKALNHRLLKPNEWGNFYFKFNINAITRGDMKSRFEAYNLGRNMGVYSANDIRELEDLNPIENGDIYLQPLNMSEAGKGDNGQNDA